MTQRSSATSSSILVAQNIRWRAKLNWPLLAAVVLTFANGLAISFLIFPLVSEPAGLNPGPADGWAETAANIVAGRGFVYDPWALPTASTGHLTREPVYALFLAFVLGIFGELDSYLAFLQAAVNALTCFALYVIARKTFNRRIALIGSFFYALYPFASWYVPRIAYETLLGLLVTLLALGVVNVFEELSLRRGLILGLILGITVLCKGTYLLLPLALLPALMVRFGVRNTGAIRVWGAVVLTMVAVLAPWIARNYVLSGEFVPVTAHGGAAFFYGEKIIEHYSLRENTAGELPGEESTGLYNNVRDSIRSRHPNFSYPKIEVDVDRELVRTAFANILSDPLKFIKKVLLGLVFVWFLGDTSLKSNALLVMQGPLLFLALLGIFWSLKSKRPVLPLVTILIYFILIQTAFLSLGRFSYPMVPILVAFAAYAAEMLRSKYLYPTAGAVE
jgi:4-amino-4-deoxy-L-arabinose transferase-like glycosyltransferase